MASYPPTDFPRDERPDTGSPRLASVHRLPVGTDDTALARALAEGHPAAPGLVWDRHSANVRALLRRMLGPWNDVEDHVQETFLRFLRDHRALRDPSALRSYLFGIAVRVAGTELRRRRRKRWLLLSGDGSLPDDRAAADDPDAREALRRLYALLDRLGDEDRMVFVLRHVQALELEAVSEALGLSLATTKRRLARAIPRIVALVSKDPLLSRFAAGGPFAKAAAGEMPPDTETPQ